MKNTENNRIIDGIVWTTNNNNSNNNNLRSQNNFHRTCISTTTYRWMVVIHFFSPHMQIVFVLDYRVVLFSLEHFIFFHFSNVCKSEKGKQNSSKIYLMHSWMHRVIHYRHEKNFYDKSILTYIIVNPNKNGKREKRFGDQLKV